MRISFENCTEPSTIQPLQARRKPLFSFSGLQRRRCLGKRAFAATSRIVKGRFGVNCRRLLNQRRLGDRRRRLLPFGFRLALLIGRVLARGDLVEGAPFRFHPHVGVAREHGAGDVPGDAHDHLVAGARFSEFRDQRVAVVVPPYMESHIVQGRAVQLPRGVRLGQGNSLFLNAREARTRQRPCNPMHWPLEVA